MIDFHCHLDLYPKPERVIEECASRRMYVLSVTTTPSAWEGTSALADGHDRIRTAIGLHPQLAAQRKGELPRFSEFLSKTRYVGEVGLDGTQDCINFWQDQVEVFEFVLDACASAGGRIMSIHSRRAEDEVLSLFEQRPDAGLPILHWYSGSWQNLRRAIDLGCWFSVGLSMLRTKKGRELVAMMPRDRVLTESDGPFALQRGQPAMPWSVKEACQGLGELWKLEVGEVEATLAQNLRSLAQIRPG